MAVRVVNLSWNLDNNDLNYAPFNSKGTRHAPLYMASLCDLLLQSCRSLRLIDAQSLSVRQSVSEILYDEAIPTFFSLYYIGFSRQSEHKPQVTNGDGSERDAGQIVPRSVEDFGQSQNEHAYR